MAEDINDSPQITRMSLGRIRGVGYQINDAEGRYVVLDVGEALRAARAIIADLKRRGIVMPFQGDD